MASDYYKTYTDVDKNMPRRGKMFPQQGLIFYLPCAAVKGGGPRAVLASRRERAALDCFGTRRPAYWRERGARGGGAKQKPRGMRGQITCGILPK